MPDTKDFLASFNLVSGNIFENCKLISVKSQHIELERYRKYKFIITAVFESKNTGRLIKALNNHLLHHTTVNSRYGNPYDCFIDTININSRSEGKYVVDIIGLASRIFK